MITDKIEFHNKEYLIREIELPKIGNVLISTVELNDLLMNDKGGYVSDEAISVDEKIYYFVQENEIKLSDDDLIKLLKEQAS
ncbi:hypothetical protein A5893_09920 [Pedobacter psychrophilus]|uniref:Uncharacterized protein n=1 Tax=Pedobacter psychrophilus TaxID=1826909 RepID=A0A179DFP2_9SPHI|nr:hypothetical protein [Pedobacter psychrophilus]OAQ39875.1 hypothetical protein A5893_09920 [Pedobacter psychrophilus]